MGVRIRAWAFYLQWEWSLPLAMGGPNSSGSGRSHWPCAFYLQWEWSLPKGVAKPTRHGRSIFTGSGHSHSPWAFDFEWEWPLPRAMGVLYSVGVVTPSLNNSIIYVLEASYIPRQIR